MGAFRQWKKRREALKVTLKQRKFIIVNELTGEKHETTDYKTFCILIQDIINNYGTIVYYNPINNENTTYYKPIQIIREYYTQEENAEMEEKATIKGYKDIINPYSIY